MTVSAVHFGAIPATSFNVNSATEITAVVPPGTGTVNVRVTGPGGQSAVSANFTYSAAPVPNISNLNPNEGLPAGGTSVVITGTNFTGTTQVRFGATNAASFTVNSATQITAVSPAGTGTVQVTVTTPNGTSGGMNFTYAAAVGPEAIAIFLVPPLPAGQFPPPEPEGTLWWQPNLTSLHIYILQGMDMWMPV